MHLTKNLFLKLTNIILKSLVEKKSPDHDCYYYLCFSEYYRQCKRIRNRNRSVIVEYKLCFCFTDVISRNIKTVKETESLLHKKWPDKR